MDTKSAPKLAALDNTALAKHAAAIRQLGKQTVENVIEIGRRLAECRKLVVRGKWLPWLDREFGWTEQTALNFMRAHDLSKSKKFLDLNLPVSALYLLAAPSTPEPAKTEVIERAQAGEAIPVAEVKRVVERHKPPSRKPSKAKPAKAAPPPAADVQAIRDAWPSESSH